MKYTFSNIVDIKIQTSLIIIKRIIEIYFVNYNDIINITIKT